MISDRTVLAHRGIMAEMADMISCLRDRGIATGSQCHFQEGTHPPGRLTMIDGMTERDCSPMVTIFFSLVGEWTGAFGGKTIIRPGNVPGALARPETRECLEHRYLVPGDLPPAGEGNVSRSTLLAFHPDGLGETYLWWAAETDVEPIVIDYTFDDACAYVNLHAFLTAVAERRASLDIARALREAQSKRPRSGHLPRSVFLS